MEATTTEPRGRKLALAGGLAAAGILWLFLYNVLPSFSDFLTAGVLGLDLTKPLGSSVSFFLYDVPKIFLLLTGIVFVVGIVRSFFTPERTRSALGGKREGVGNVLAASLGIVTPFCSCSAVPLFIGFVESGVPLGVTFSFLIAAPMINEVAVVLLYGMFGLRVAAIYIVAGLLIATVAGFVIGKLKLERFVADWVYAIRMGQSSAEDESLDFEGRVRFALGSVRDIVGRVWLYVVIGIAVGALIHGYLPEDLLAGVMGKSAWWSVPMAVLIGIPMYSNAAGVIPVVQALMEKGASIGTVLAFMMSVIALSLPEIIILRKVLKWPLIAVFIGVVGAGIILVGYLFNAII